MTVLAARLRTPAKATRADLALAVVAIAMVGVDVIAQIHSPIGSTPGAVASYLSDGVIVIAGIVSLRRDDQRGNGRLMLAIPIASSIADFCGDLAGIGPFAFLWNAFSWLPQIMLGHLLLRWPRARLQTAAQRVAAVAAYALVPSLTIASQLVDSAKAFGVKQSVWWPSIVIDDPLAGALWRIDVGCFGVLLGVFFVLVVIRFARAPKPERFEFSAVLLAILLNIVSGAIEVAGDLGLPADSYLVSNIALAIVPLAFLGSVAVRRIQRALAIESLTAHTRDVDASGVLRELRRATGDRALNLAIYSVEAGGYRTAEGAPAPEVGLGREAVFVPSGDGSPLARLDVARSLSRRSELSGSIAQAAVIALESARLRAELVSRQADQVLARQQLEAASAEGDRLSRMLPGGVPEKLRTDPGALGRVDESVVSVLMSDVRGYTAIAEHTPPAQLAQQLREHRAAMNGAILAEGGTVMQYVGDAVMAVFGAPFAQADHAARALRAATAMHAAQDATNQAWLAAGWRPFGLGIGVSSGPVATAILGSDERYEYTIVGDTVNLAQRLETAARPGGTTIVSATTVEQVGDPRLGVRPLPLMTVKGRAEPVRAYHLIRPQDSVAPPEEILTPT